MQRFRWISVISLSLYMAFIAELFKFNVIYFIITDKILIDGIVFRILIISLMYIEGIYFSILSKLEGVKVGWVFLLAISSALFIFNLTLLLI